MKFLDDAGCGRVPLDALLEKSALYGEFLAEREEILKHKWFES